MKIAKIVPVFKAGNKKIINNYRPIIILPAFSKIPEQLVSIRLIHVLESQNILYKHQCGFRQNYSTIHSILHLLNDISTANDNKSKYITLAFFRHVEGIWHHKPRHPNREFRIERHHSHRAILNLEQVAPLVAGGGGAQPPEQLTNSQTSHYSSNNTSSSSATQNNVK